METFKFNFGGQSEVQVEQSNSKPTDSKPQNQDASKVFHTVQEVVEIGSQRESIEVTEMELLGGIKVVKSVVSLDKAAELLDEQDVRNMDVVKGKYEGGFKLWEGAVDLANYLIEFWKLSNNSQGALVQGADLQQSKVLELGCGQGIPGIIAGLCGAEVHFQDYNQQVLENVTMVNVDKSYDLHGATRISRYFSGDWSSFMEYCAINYMTAQYDFILAAETIYEVEQYESFVACLKALLHPPNGVAFVSAKSYYFGVGGGVSEFIKYVRKDGVLVPEIVRKIDDQQGNKREIIKLSFPEILQPYFS
eukprot:TRINITY_DN97194_c0_g1_i1.p1 TRINITY_DN97194_c0_g1~~TRINITY_DN97194_c0_g1_i1.p1  ORF type:complete len:306 (-),score=38.64 TRINITY_DN97194_c0_g1_i1:188-1105(-)